MKTSLLYAALVAMTIGCLAAEEKSLFLGSRKVTFEIANGKPKNKGVVFLSLHSNEKTAVKAVKDCLKETPGKLVAINAGGDRRLHLAPGKSNVTIDPNRMFSPDGIERDLKRYGIPRPGDSKLVYDFGKKYFETFIEGEKCIVAIHNNTNGRYSILSYKPGGSEAGATEDLFIDPNKDPDDFFLVTMKSDFDKIKKDGHNVVLQSRTPPDDGSLSVLCSMLNIRYVNIEAESGNLAKQTLMVKYVVELTK